MNKYRIFYRQDARVSTSDNRMSTEKKTISENDTDNVEKDMSPDSSEDATKSSNLGVKKEKIMYTCPHKLEKIKNIPDCVSFINDSTASENPFVGQVDGRLNPSSSDKYNAITKNFNLYETPEDSLSDNNVSSSNYVTYNSEYAGIHSKNKNETTIPSKVNKCSKHPIPHKKKVVISEEVTTSDESKPHIPVNTPNGVLKGIWKSELYVKVERCSEKKINDLLSVNEISDNPFPKFSFMICDFRSEKEKNVAEKNNVSTNYGNFNKWRDLSNANEYAEKGKIEKHKKR